MALGKVILGLVVAGALAGAVVYSRKQESTAAAEGPRYRTATVASGPIKVVVAASGVVEPVFKVDVKSKASGAVLSFAKEPGDKVVQGESLVELDPVDEARNVRLSEAELASNQASLAAAEADLGLADSKLARARGLAEKGLATPDELDAADFGRKRTAAAVDSMKSALVRSGVSLELARQRLADTRITAPMTGVMLTKAVDKGHIIASGITSVSGGTTLATIADMSRVFILASIDESDVGRVRPGATVEITVDAYRDVAFEGRVERIMPLGVSEQNVTVFKAKIEVVSENKSLLLPSMTADVKVLVAERTSALLVPNAALREREGKSGVEVLPSPGASPEFRPVVRGLTDGMTTEVTGVAEGDVVVTGEEARKDAAPSGFGMFGMGGGRRGGASTGASAGAGARPAGGSAGGSAGARPSAPR